MNAHKLRNKFFMVCIIEDSIKSFENTFIGMEKSFTLYIWENHTE